MPRKHRSAYRTCRLRAVLQVRLSQACCCMDSSFHSQLYPPGNTRHGGPLTTQELSKAETYLWLQAQSDNFLAEKNALQGGSSLTRKSRLRVLHPIAEKSGLLRVGGRVHNSDFSFAQRHPVILHGNHPLIKLLIRAEHIRLLHAGPTLVSSSLGRTLHIIGQRRAVRTITRACVTCRRTTARPQNQLMGQLPTCIIIVLQLGLLPDWQCLIACGRLKSAVSHRLIMSVAVVL